LIACFSALGAPIRFQVLDDMGVHVDIGLRPDRASLAEGQVYITSGDGSQVQSPVIENLQVSLRSRLMWLHSLTYLSLLFDRNNNRLGCRAALRLWNCVETSIPSEMNGPLERLANERESLLLKKA
jgi:hypothetical protein